MSEVRVSFPPVGVVTTFSCLTVMSPVGSKPLPSATSAGVNVKLVALTPAVLVTVLPPIVKVTVAPGTTSVTVIPVFGRPPVFVT